MTTDEPKNSNCENIKWMEGRLGVEISTIEKKNKELELREEASELKFRIEIQKNSKGSQYRIGILEARNTSPPIYRDILEDEISEEAYRL